MKNNLIRLLPEFLFLLALVGVGFCAYAVFINMGGHLDSDALFPLLFAESVINPTGNFMWYVPQATFLFPDVLLGIGIRLLGFKGEIFLITWAVMFYVGITAAIFALFHTIGKDKLASTLAASLVVISIFLLYGPEKISKYFMLPVYHVGIIFAALILLWLSILILEYGPRARLLVGLGVICALGSFSDRLFVVQFAVPMAAIAPFFFRKSRFLVVTVLALGCGLGYLMERITLLLPQFNKVGEGFSFSLTKSLASISLIPEKIGGIFTGPSNLPAALVIIVGVGMGLALVGSRKRLITVEVSFNNAFALAVTFALVSCITSFFATFLVGSATDMPSDKLVRHQLPTFTFPLLIIGLTVMQLAKTVRTVTLTAVCLLVFCLFFVSLFILNSTYSSHLAFFPNEKNLYKELTKMNVQGIFTDPATANIFRVIGNKDIPLWQVSRRISNVGWYEQALTKFSVGSIVAVVWSKNKKRLPDLIRYRIFDESIAIHQVHQYKVLLFEFTPETREILAADLATVIAQVHAKRFTWSSRRPRRTPSIAEGSHHNCCSSLAKKFLTSLY
jgi:hypothetical protein